MRRELSVADRPRLDDALLTVGQRDEGTELHDLRVAEVFAKLRLDAIVGPFGIPDEHARVEKRRLLTRRETFRPLEVQ